MAALSSAIGNEYWCGLLSQPNETIFNLAVSKGIGEFCYIEIGPPGVRGNDTDACEFYVTGQSAANATDENNGIPLTTKGLGNGCIFHQDASPFCHYLDQAYPLSEEERDAMCTVSIVDNAAAQLRYGIRNGYCTSDPIEQCATEANEPITSQAPTTNATNTPSYDHDLELVEWELRQQLTPFPKAADVQTSFFSANSKGRRLAATTLSNAYTSIYQLRPTAATMGNVTWNHIASFEANNHEEQLQEEWGIFTMKMSGDGTHVIVGMNNQEMDSLEDPFSSAVAVYAASDYPLGASHWTLKHRTTPYFRRTTEEGFAREAFSSRSLEQGVVAISHDGARLAFPVSLYQWSGFDWDQDTTKQGYRVYEWNGTHYAQMGETLVIENAVESSLFQMDPSGTFLYVAGKQYFYHTSSSRWETTGEVPLGLVSPSGLRVAKADRDRVVIYQRDRYSYGWDDIATIQAPYAEGRNDAGFGEAMMWGMSDKALIIGAPREERPRDPDEERIEGAVYVFQETKCTAGDGGVNCIFLQVGDTQCRGTRCGEQVHISDDGQKILYSTYLAPDDMYLLSMTRKTPSPYLYLPQTPVITSRSWSLGEEETSTEEQLLEEPRRQTAAANSSIVVGCSLFLLVAEALFYGII